MARISYVDINDITDPEMRADMENSILRRAAEPKAVYAHSPVVFKYFFGFQKDLREEGNIDPELMELIRVRVATSWERMFEMEEMEQGCHY